MVASRPLPTRKLRVAAVLTAVCLSVFALSGNALAAANGNFTMGPSFSGIDLRTGFYSGVEGGRARSDFSASDANLPGFPVESGRVDDDSYFVRLFIGWLFHPNLAAELGVAHFGDYEWKDLNYGGDENASADVDIGGVDAALKLVMPVSDQIRLFTRGGIAYLRAESDDRISPAASSTNFKILDGEDRITWLIAIGATFAINQAFELYVAWAHYSNSGDIAQIETVSAGFVYQAL